MSVCETGRKPWWNLTEVWLAIATTDWPPPPSIYDSLGQYGNFQKTYWGQLVAAFSAEQYPMTKEKLLKHNHLPIPEQMELRKMSLQEQVRYRSSEPEK